VIFAQKKKNCFFHFLLLLHCYWRKNNNSEKNACCCSLKRPVETVNWKKKESNFFRYFERLLLSVTDGCNTVNLILAITPYSDCNVQEGAILRVYGLL
jgi:hypothetical protein